MVLIFLSEKIIIHYAMLQNVCQYWYLYMYKRKVYMCKNYQHEY